MAKILVHDDMRRQLALKRLRQLQRYGRRRAAKLGVGPMDAEALVDEFRSKRS